MQHMAGPYSWVGCFIFEAAARHFRSSPKGTGGISVRSGGVLAVSSGGTASHAVVSRGGELELAAYRRRRA